MITLISSKQGAGKSTIAELLRQRCAETFASVEIYKFAGVLYEMHDEIQLILKQYAPHLFKPKDGDLLQLLGTEWGRKCLGENVWCDILKARIEKESSQIAVAIIDDCRFENEFNTFPQALRVRLDCAESIRRERASYWRKDTNHPSEVGLDNYADEGMFDLYLRTDMHTVDHCVEMIMAQLVKQSWIDKRHPHTYREFQ